MPIKNIINNLSTTKFYVAEVVNGKEFRVTANFAFKADAESAMKRMIKGDYVVKTAQFLYQGKEGDCYDNKRSNDV